MSFLLLYPSLSLDQPSVQLGVNITDPMITATTAAMKSMN